MPVKQDDWRVECPRCSNVMEYQRTKKLGGGCRGWYYLCPVCSMKTRVKDSSDGEFPCRFAVDFDDCQGGDIERKCSKLDIQIAEPDSICGGCSLRDP